MAKIVYCENCGQGLAITRRALPKLGKIIETIPYHLCPRDPQIKDDLDFDFTPLGAVPYSPPEKKGFVKELVTRGGHDESKIFPHLPSGDIRPKGTKREELTTAPTSILDQIKSLGRSD